VTQKRTIEVVAWDPAWAEAFEALRAVLADALGDVAQSIEHVGSTSVPGLHAKPIIDLDVIVRAERLGDAIEVLEGLGLTHRGDLGIEGRHAFTRLPGHMPHNLYVCIEGCDALTNHLKLRDHLEAHPAAVQAYGALKQKLAAAHPHDIDAYVEGKTEFILEILRREGMGGGALEDIERANKTP